MAMEEAHPGSKLRRSQKDKGKTVMDNMHVRSLYHRSGAKAIDKIEYVVNRRVVCKSVFQANYPISAATLRRANVLRASGVRLDISEKNVGRRKYSFNALQLRFMPDVYRPPTECIDNMVT